MIFRSVTVKFLAVFLAAWLIGMIVIGGLFGFLYQQQRITQRMTEMTGQAQLLAQAVVRSAVPMMNISVPYTEQMQAISRLYNGPVWVFDVVMGKYIMFDADAPQKDVPEELVEDLLAECLQGKTLYRTGTLNGFFSGRMLTVGVPYVQDGHVFCVVFVHSKITDIWQETFSLFEKLAAALLIATLIGMAVIGWLSNRIARPLREMDAMAGEIRHGKYDRRIHIRGSDEVARLGNSLNNMSESLKNLDRLQVGFVANVTHELRSPLTSVQGYIQGMRDGVIPQEDYDEYLGIVYDETVRMNKLVNDLLDLSRMDSEQFVLNKTRFDLNELVRRTLIAFHGKIDDKQIEVNINFCNDPCFVVADADRIRQVMGNLLDNAIKFTEPTGSISILTKANGDKVTLSVADSGVGIPEEELPFVFERFYKVDKAHTSGAGTGLGLAITKQIITQHKQEIWVDSPSGKGAVFAFTLEAANGKDS